MPLAAMGSPLQLWDAPCSHGIEAHSHYFPHTVPPGTKLVGP
jgi:hypothetical protein